MKHVKIESLDSMRGIAALLVVFYHIGWNYSLRDWEIVRGGYLMVDFFFVLSGFVIALSSSNKLNSFGELKNFLYKRLIRLYPVHLFFMLIFVGYELIKLTIHYVNPVLLSGVPFTGNNSLDSLALNVFLAHGWGGVDYLSWNSPSWSISVELLVYLFFAVSLLIFGRFGKRLHLFISIVSVFYIVTNYPSLNVNIQGGLVRCISGFFVGVVTYNIYSSKLILNFRSIMSKRNSTILDFLQLLCMASFIFVVYLHDKLSGVEFFIIPISACLVFLLAIYDGLLVRFLCMKPLQHLGKMSYSIYLSHMIIVIIVYSFIKFIFDYSTVDNVLVLNPIYANVCALLVFTVVVFTSYFSHKYIEVRFTNYLKKITFNSIIKVYK
ncbi:acyltransferase family protein [Vibrio cyclitrophicus]